MGFTKKQCRDQKKQQIHQKSHAKKAPAHNTAQQTERRRDRDNLATSGKPNAPGNNAAERSVQANPMIPPPVLNV